MILKNKFKKFLILSILYTILFLNSSISYANEVEIVEDTEEISLNESSTNTLETNEDLNLNAYAAVLIDADTGLVLYDQNMNEKLYPASMTKVMTVLLALEYGNLDDIVTHSHNAVYNIGPGSSHIGMRENEEITLEQALYGMLLASANEVCMAVAEHISGSVEAFVEKMNEKAKELGALNTHFANPHGFHDDNHYTTCYDMSLIMKEAIKYDKFNEIISTETYTIPATNIVDEERILNNTNRMIKSWSEFYYPNVIGGKTGFTDQAKNTLTTYARNGDINLISVVMKADGTEVYSDTAKLLDYGFSIYEEKEIFNKDSFKTTTSAIQKFNETTIELGEIEVLAESNVSLNLPNFINIEDIEKNVNLEENIEGPIAIGDKIGTLEFMYDGYKIGEVSLISNTVIDIIPETKLVRQEKIKSFFNTSLKILKYIIIFIVLAIIFLFVSSLIVKNIRKKRRKNLRFSNNNYYYNKRRNKYKKRRF